MPIRSQRIVVYDVIRWWHLPGVFLRLIAHPKVKVLRLNLKDKLIFITRFLIRAGFIEVFKLNVWPHRVYNPSVERAIENAETLYHDQYKFQKIPTMTAGFFGSEEVGRAFQKGLSEKLQAHYEFNMWKMAIEKELGCGFEWMFVPSGLGKIFDQRDQISVGEKGCHFSLLTQLAGHLHSIIEKLKWIGLGFYSILRSALHYLRGLWSQPVKNQIEYCIAIVSPKREFAYGPRGLEFLLDGSRIRKDNTIFVPYTRLTKNQKEILKKKELRLAQYGAITYAELKEGTKILLHILVRAWVLPGWLLKTAVLLLYERLIWNAFLSKNAPRNFISYADYSVRHIARSLTLSQSGVVTWYYADAEFTYETMPGPLYKDIGFGYMTFDHCVSWSVRYENYLKRHKPQIKHYHHVGCLWSELVRLLKTGELESNFADRLKLANYHSTAKVIGVFDAFYHNDGLLPISAGVLYAQAIAKLLEDFPDVYIVFKEKKWVGFYSDEGSEELEAIYKILANHQRCFFPGFSTSTPEVLAFCQLCISFPFGSPTVEALSGGIKGIYFSPDKRYAGGYFDQVPGLVICEYENLRKRVNELLYEISETEYTTYLRVHAQQVVDPYLDGFGLTRFRDLLSAKLSRT